MLFFLFIIFKNKDKNKDNKPISYFYILKIQSTISYK